jgi:putative transposase
VSIAIKRKDFDTPVMNTCPNLYRRHRFPPEIISHCVWLYFIFSLSFRDVELMMAQCGVVLIYETIRQWCLKFGHRFANDLRRRRARTGDKWHLDEVFIGINGETRYLWRAVDQDGNVLDILVQTRRDKTSAKLDFIQSRGIADRIC